MAAVSSFEIAVDNTASMGAVCTAIKAAAAPLAACAQLLLGRIDVSVVGDYDHGPRGGVESIQIGATDVDPLVAFLETHVHPHGGGDSPEAFKTYFHNLIDRHTAAGGGNRIVFLYTDAAPHGDTAATLGANGKLEMAALRARGKAFEWKAIAKATRDAGIHVVTFHTSPSTAGARKFRDVGHVTTCDASSVAKIIQDTMAVFNGLFADAPSVVAGVSRPTWASMSTTTSLEHVAKSAAPSSVLPAFRFLLASGGANGVEALMTSPVLGRFWRLVCGKFRFIEDGAHAAACDAAAADFSRAAGALPDDRRAAFKQWLDATHDATEEIVELTARNMKQSLTHVLVLPSRGDLSVDDIRELSRSGKCAEVARLIASLEVVPYDRVQHVVVAGEAPSFAPIVADGGGDTFRLIANLLKPGLLFSQAEAHRAAILSLANAHLAATAHSWLADGVGTWISWELKPDGDGMTPMFPANWSIEFFKLLARAPDDVLTASEREFSRRALAVATVLHNLDATVPVTTALDYGRTKHSGLTWRRTCGACNVPRCFTLFPGSAAVCVLCSHLALATKDAYKNPSSIGVDNPADARVCTLVKCRTCHVHYSLANPPALNVDPKCYYCRIAKTPAPRITCTGCLADFVDQDGAAAAAVKACVGATTAAGPFRCARCFFGSVAGTTAEAAVPMRALIEQNPALRAAVPFRDAVGAIFAPSVSFRNRIHAARELLEPDVVAAALAAAIAAEQCGAGDNSLLWNGLRVHGSAVAKAVEVARSLLVHPGVEECALCFGNVAVRNVGTACGAGGCPNRICAGCRESWYGAVRPGAVVVRARTECPFCKRVPTHAAAGKTPLALVRNVRAGCRTTPRVEWDHRDTVYGLCERCFCILPARDRGEGACGAAAAAADGDEHSSGAPTLPPHWKCVACDKAVFGRGGGDAAAKPCPGCAAPTFKDGGCNHVSCTQCDTDWCWSCGGREDADGSKWDSIYDHMAGCGGIYS
jgi:hypothetical protein